jgi:hypothetical protein
LNFVSYFTIGPLEVRPTSGGQFKTGAVQWLLTSWLDIFVDFFDLKNTLIIHRANSFHSFHSFIFKISRKYEMIKIIKCISAASAVALLAACGDGGVETNPAQGIWGNTTVSAFRTSLVVLENGETWMGIHGNAGPPLIWFTGTATVAEKKTVIETTTVIENTVSLALSSFTGSSSEPQSADGTGSYVAKSTISITDPEATTFSYQPTYDTAATLAAISGEWEFDGTYSKPSYIIDPTLPPVSFVPSTALTPTNVTIESNGVFTLTEESGCVIAGVLTPRPGGKNVYNLALTTTGPTCMPSRNIMSGIAYIDTSVSPNQFNLIAVTSSKADSLYLIATKNESAPG